MTHENAAQTTTGSDEAEAVLDEIRETPLPEGETPALDIRLPAEHAALLAQFCGQLDADDADHRELLKSMQGVLLDFAARRAERAKETQALFNATLRKLAVTEDLLRRERETSRALRALVEKHAAIMQTQIACINAATDAAAAESHEASDYERLYREQYEHEPEPRDDDHRPDVAADLERSLMMPPATSPVQVHYEAQADDHMPAFLRNLSRTDTFDEADVWAEPETPSRMIARGFRNLKAILDAMRNPFRQATPSRRIA